MIDLILASKTTIQLFVSFPRQFIDKGLGFEKRLLRSRSRNRERTKCFFLMSDYVRSLLSDEQEQNLVDAITQAELQTSGEIRIHLEKSTGKYTAENRAKHWFGKLNMHKTEEKNGVLFYLANSRPQSLRYGQERINQEVPDNFWQEIVI